MQLNFFQLLLLGYKNYWKGVKFILTHKLYWYVVFPIVLFLGVYWLGSYFKSVEYSIGANLNQHDGVNTINGLIWHTFKLLFFYSLNIIFTKFALYIVVVLLSPVLSIISEKIEEILTGNKYKFNFYQLMHDVRRGMKIALRNIMWEYFFIILVLGLASFFDDSIKSVLVFSIPVIFGFYFYGFSFIDYINERRRLNIQQSVNFVSKHKGLAMAIGSIYSVFFLSYHLVFRKFDTLPTDPSTQIFWGTILVVTFCLATVAPIIAITSATLSMHELVDLSKNDHAIKTNQFIEEDKNEPETESQSSPK